MIESGGSNPRPQGAGTPQWVVISALHPGVYPYEDQVMLHDMRADPHQTVNLAGERPNVVDELGSRLAEWRQQQIRESGRPDPLEEMIPYGPFLYYGPEQMAARLERTGRAHIVPSFKARINQYHPGRFS